MAGFEALVTGGGGCGDGFGSSATKFANSFLSAQQLQSEWRQSSGGGEGGQLLLGGPEAALEQHFPLLGDAGVAGELPVGLLHGDLEAEFLSGDGDGPWSAFHGVAAPHLPLAEGSSTSQMLQYTLDVFSEALSHGALSVPHLPAFFSHANQLAHPDKVQVVRQLNRLLSDFNLPSQSVFDSFLLEGLKAFCIPPEVLEEVALEDEWQQAQQQTSLVHHHQHQHEQAALEAAWAQAQSTALVHPAALAHPAAVDELNALEEEFHHHFSLEARRSALWEQEYVAQQPQDQLAPPSETQLFEEEYQLATAQNQAQQWQKEFEQQQLTADQLMRKEEEEWFAQFLPQTGAPSAQAASWIDEMLGTPHPLPSIGHADDLTAQFLAQEGDPLVQEFLAHEAAASSSSPASALSQFQANVRQVASEIGQDPHLHSSNVLSFLNSVADGQLNVNALPPTTEQSFFPS